MGKPEVVQRKCCRPSGNRPEPPRTMAIESALPTTDRGREADEGLRVGLRIRRIPPSRRLNSLFPARRKSSAIGHLMWCSMPRPKPVLSEPLIHNTSLPGVSGTHLLTGGDYGPPGSRRLTGLTDGSRLVEEVPENVRDKNSAQIPLRRLELHRRKRPSDCVRSRTLRSNGSRLRPHSHTVDVFVSAESPPLPG
jgi:hypothetical protein